MKKGDKFYCTATNMHLTAKSFFGESSIEYNTSEEAKKNNSAFICIKNAEFNGTTLLKDAK